MPRRASRRANTPPPPLSQRLLLARWFASKLGYDNVGKMLLDCREQENVGNGRGVMNLILERDRTTISKPLLGEMDEAIRGDMERINKSRPVPLSLKYFQYLAALAAEYVLRRIGDSTADLAKELNAFAAQNSVGMPDNSFPRMEGDNPAHFSKLAFWMATGAGKTLLMHLNYLQFMRAGTFAPGNILLITPNADMSAQHLEEMRASSIPCRAFDPAAAPHLQKNAVSVLDINKLTGKKHKSKKGISVPPEMFSGRNLVFVDEGHKGAGGKVWFDIRDRLTKNGFAMEYSATFGNAAAALTGEKKESFSREYARAIAFDYSYGRFHGDGYGKDYFILNMTGGGDEENDRRRQTLMTGNLLAFFQQQFAYRKHPDIVREFQIAPPLLLMLGATVIGGKKVSDEQRQERADILNLIAFLRRAASDNAFLQATVKKILGNKSGLRDEDGNDLFAQKFEWLRHRYKDDVAKICADLREHVFHMKAPGNLKIRPIKKTMRIGGGGEIALRAENAKPCALVYVGAARQFADMCRERFGQSEVLEDPLQPPLFAGARDSESPVNILVGARKFMEGWSSWRVSGIGLLNIGKKEGAMIVQLFGRGVRLQGKNWSLKRAAASPLLSDDKNRIPLAILETLNIFGIRANFMSEFSDYLKEDDAIWLETSVNVQIMPKTPKVIGGSISRSRPEKLREAALPFPVMQAAEEFSGTFALRQHSKVAADVDMRASFVVARPREDGDSPVQPVVAENTRQEFADALKNNLIDIDRLYMRLLREYKPPAGAMTVGKGDLRDVLEKCGYHCDTDSALSPARLQTAAFAAVCQYANTLFAIAAGKWKRKGMRMAILDDDKKRHRNFEDYTVRMPAAEKARFDEIRGLVEKQAAWLYHTGGNDALPRIYFPHHLSQPLPVSRGKVRISPPPLNEGEEKFIEYLHDYADNGDIPKGDMIYALRNHSRLGIEFVLKDGSIHYPDFLLWVAGKNRRRLVFAEPHGLRNESPSFAKGRLWKWLKKLDPQQLRPPKHSSMKVEMDSFVISVTDFNTLQKQWDKKWDKEEFAKNHILFMEDLANERQRGETFARMFYPNGGD